MKNIFTTAFALILLMVICSTARADWTEIYDTLKTDETWSGDTVRVYNNVFVPDDVKLTIEAGTVVAFEGPYCLYIHGAIVAVGTEIDTIVFTRTDTSGWYQESLPDGAWDGITFHNGTGYGGADGAMLDNDTSKFEYCRLEFTKSHPSEMLVWGAIEVVAYSKVLVRNSEIRNNYSHHLGAAIKCMAGGDITVYNNHIHHNRSWDGGGAIYLANSDTKIIENTIEYNTTLSLVKGYGGAIYSLGGAPVIKRNTIMYNSAIQGSGISFWNCFGSIRGNTIAFNTGYDDGSAPETIGGGISCGGGTSAKVFNNEIADNMADKGGGFYVIDSDPRITGNLIVNNTGSSSGGALHGNNFTGEFVNNTVANNESDKGGALEIIDSKPRFMNNIIWNNHDGDGEQINLAGYFSELHVENSVIENGLSTFTGESTPSTSGMLEDNPDFINPGVALGQGGVGLSKNWKIADSSVCVNMGSENMDDIFLPWGDLDGKPRLQHSVIDIGAYEVYVPSMVVTDTIKENTTWIADTVLVDSNIFIEDEVTLTILPGTWVKFRGRYQIQVLGTLLAEGTEDEPIHFTMADSAGNSNPWIEDGSWRGIMFNNEMDGFNNVMSNNDSSVLKYCNLEYVKSIGGEEFEHSAVYVSYFDRLIIDNCTFRDNKAVVDNDPATIFLYKSDITITGSEFYNNTGSAGPAIVAENSSFSIENCSFDNNYAHYRGGAVRTSACDLYLYGNRFTYNWADNRGGALHMDRTVVLAVNNLFANNGANSRGGAITANYDNGKYINNVIVNNYSGNAGGGIYTLYTDEVLTVNNTICNNWAQNGGGMYTAFCGHTSINDLFYGNEVEYDGSQYCIYSVTSEINFQHALLQGGIDEIGFWVGQELTGSYTNIIDSVPEFIRPSDGAGNWNDGVDSRWWVKSISPCINQGTLIASNILEDVDFRGNPRVYDELIDIGAYESQYGLPEIQSQPDNIIGCVGDTVMFKVSSRFQSTFQWQKDGVDIPGATSNSLELDSITTNDDGNYKCLVSNSFGSLESNSAYLLARSAPEFVRQPENIWAIEGEKTILTSTAIGTQPIDIQWYKDGLALPGKKFPDLWIFNSDSASEGRYHCEVQNACDAVQSDTVQLYIAPQICMVTVDTTTGDNLIIWEKKTTAPIASYNIYRESIVAGEYDAIGNVPASDLSVYTDTAANPIVQAYIYKITAMTADGFESDIELCEPHKTIHLLTSLNTEYKTAQLDWDEYYGFDYGTYHIYRAGDVTGFSVIHAMASSTATWLDVTATEGVEYYYRVAVEKLPSCYPTGNGKAGTGPYHQSLSNLDDNKLKSTTGIDDVMAGGMKIFPNPFTDRCTVEFINPELSEYRVTIRDISGKIVLTKKISEDKLILERGDLRSGLYSIELAGERIYRSRFVVK